MTPELQSGRTIGTDPLPPGQIWAISPGGLEEHSGLYRIDVNVGLGSGIKIINYPVPGPFRESMKYAEQNLLIRAKELVGDRDPRHHEFMVQLRAYDAAKNGDSLGLPALLALSTALLGKSLKGGLIAVGGINLGGALDPVHNAVSVAEIAVEKGATMLLIPISARRQLNELSDDMAMKLIILYYADAREALIKAFRSEYLDAAVARYHETGGNMQVLALVENEAPGVGGDHAAKFETSYMLYLNSDTVTLQRLAAEPTDDVGGADQIIDFMIEAYRGHPCYGLLGIDPSWACLY